MGDVVVTKQALPTSRKPGQCILTNFVPLQLLAHIPNQSKPTIIWDNNLKHSNRSVRPLRKISHFFQCFLHSSENFSIVHFEFRIMSWVASNNHILEQKLPVIIDLRNLHIQNFILSFVINFFLTVGQNNFGNKIPILLLKVFFLF